MIVARSSGLPIAAASARSMGSRVAERSWPTHSVGQLVGGLEHHDRLERRQLVAHLAGSCRGSPRSRRSPTSRRSARRGRRPVRATRSCRSTPASRRRRARRGRASGTPGCCASSARRDRPAPTPRDAQARLRRVATFVRELIEGQRRPTAPRPPSTEARTRTRGRRRVCQELPGDRRVPPPLRRCRPSSARS